MNTFKPIKGSAASWGSTEDGVLTYVYYTVAEGDDDE